MHPSLLVSLIVGDLLFILGFLAFFLGGSEHPTAFIPAVFGVVIQTAAIIAHFFHGIRTPLVKVILIVAFVGLVVGGARPIMTIMAGGNTPWTLALASQAGMALGCAVVFFASLILLLGQAIQRS
ncbi:MAG TPA: hypothetical protein PLS24_06735 [Sedimentisphaerales bacterium]|nr:hypothetical protein [Sedimentisphaerales bacterium]